jgi:hypothetical protein
MKMSIREATLNLQKPCTSARIAPWLAVSTQLPPHRLTSGYVSTEKFVMLSKLFLCLNFLIFCAKAMQFEKLLVPMSTKVGRKFASLFGATKILAYE